MGATRTNVGFVSGRGLGGVPAARPHNPRHQDGQQHLRGSLMTQRRFPDDRNGCIVCSGQRAHGHGPGEPKPCYTEIDSQPLHRLVYGLFRRKMVAALDGRDSSLPGYDGIIDLTRRLNALGSPQDTQSLTRKILLSLFPGWLPPAFKVMFARPLPGVSCKLNAFATWLTCQWLMGECEINSVEVDGGAIGEGYGVLVKRCRYLEESGCVGVCINSCKVPTQEFFAKDMGLPLTMEPNYETFECQFSFGKTPLPRQDDEAFQSVCFSQCPTKQGTGKDTKTCHRLVDDCR